MGIDGPVAPYAPASSKFELSRPDLRRAPCVCRLKKSAKNEISTIGQSWGSLSAGSGLLWHWPDFNFAALAFNVEPTGLSSLLLRRELDGIAVVILGQSWSRLLPSSRCDVAWILCSGPSVASLLAASRPGRCDGSLLGSCLEDWKVGTSSRPLRSRTKRHVICEAVEPSPPLLPTIVGVCVLTSGRLELLLGA